MKTESLWKEKKDTSKSVKDAINEYVKYARYSLNLNQKKLDNFKIYFDFLSQRCGEINIKDLSKKGDRTSLSELARSIVTLGKKECEELKDVPMSDRADFYNGFVDYISDAKAYSKGKVFIEKIPPVLSDLERKLDIVKNFRSVIKEDKEELYRRYYIKERTLRSDLSEIKSGCLNAFNQVVDIDYDIENKELFSTPVPIFLVQNITQIVALLNGLGVQAKDPRYSAYAETTALLIWQQLTPDVKIRIKEDLVDLLHLDAEWYDILEEKSEDFKLQYYTERMISRHREDILIYYKNDMKCDISYSKNNEVIRLKKVRIVDTREDYFITSASDEKLEYSNLISIDENGN